MHRKLNNSYSAKGWDALNNVVHSDTAHMLSEKASAFSGIAKERYTDLKKYASDKLAKNPSTIFFFRSISSFCRFQGYFHSD